MGCGNLIKELMKKSLLYGLALLFIILVAAALYLAFRINKEELGGEFSGTKGGVVTEVATSPTSPISKMIAEDKTGFLYEFYGAFVDKPELASGRNDRVLIGDFIIEGDGLERKIPVYLGMGSGQVILGTYQESFRSKSNWKAVSTEEFLGLISPNEPIKLVADYSLPPEVELPAYALQAQEVLDTIAQEFEKGKFEYGIPENFYVIATGVGMVKP